MSAPVHDHSGEGASAPKPTDSLSRRIVIVEYSNTIYVRSYNEREQLAEIIVSPERSISLAGELINVGLRILRQTAFKR